MHLRMLRDGRAMVAVAALLTPLPVLAQSVPPPPPSSTPSAPASPQAAQDQRINALLAQLQITPAQQPQWNAFAQAMRDNATKTDALFRQRASSAATMSALENMQSYAQIARAYADATEALAQAFASLYAVLSDQQKQTVDGIFRQDAAKNASTATAKP
jgi:protein CpxP